MQKAAFSIKNYVFDKVTIDLENNVSKDVLIDFETEGVFHEDSSSFELTFKVIAFNEKMGAESPFLIVRCKGFFSFQNVTAFEDIPDFFYRNCIAILFPYVRAYASMITTQANAPGVILPTLNLVSLESELRNKTIKK